MKVGQFMFKKIINKIKTSIWLYPTIYSLGALILSVTITFIDKLYADESAYYAYGLLYTTPALAQTVLGIVAGAFITIATFTFSTTMLVLTMYSSQFTPRVVENFLNNETTMKSFGVFLSGFIYAITSLVFINTNEDGNLVIAASVGVIYVIVGLIYFLMFIHNVSTHIQASGLILRLDKEASNKIQDYCNFIKESEIVTLEELKELFGNKAFMTLFSKQEGYIQEINYQRLLKISQDNHCIICIEKVVGQFISSETKLMKLYYEDQETLDESIERQIQQCIIIGNKKTENQDFSFTIQKIVEIALKALSPGINDPNTAIHCLYIIGLLLKHLAGIERGYVLLKEEGEADFIAYEAYDFEVILYDAYSQIIFYGQTDASVMVVVLKSLRFVRARASKKNLQIIDAFGKNLYDKLMANGFGKLEYSKIQKEYEDLTKS